MRFDQKNREAIEVRRFERYAIFTSDGMLFKIGVGRAVVEDTERAMATVEGKPLLTCLHSVFQALNAAGVFIGEGTTLRPQR